MYTVSNLTANYYSTPKANGLPLYLGPSATVSLPKLTDQMLTDEVAGLIAITGSSSEDGVSTSSVAQGTSITTGVTINAERGLITTQSATAAAGVSQTFTVTNENASATANIRAYVVNYAGVFTTNGIPVVAVDNRGAGVFDIVVSNAHGANALSGALVIGFDIVS